MPNEFTKEELEDIHNSIVIMINVHGAPCGFYDLRAKIQIMIDNYCEHDWVNGTYCEKCGRNSGL